MTRLHLNYDPFVKNIIYENKNLSLIKTKNLSLSTIEYQNIIQNFINIFLLILYFHYTKFLKIIIEIFFN